MRNKFSLVLMLSLLVLVVCSVRAQSDWERTDKETDKQKRKQTSVRTIRRTNGVIVAAPDQIIVRPALRPNVRVVRPIAPRPPVNVVRSNNYTYRTAPSYSYRTYESFGNYESDRYGNISQVARLNGYRDGLREGAKDASDGDSYNPFGERAYKDGATGYISKYGNRDAYQQSYRQSFVRGYKESFDRYLGGYDRRNW